MQYSSVPSVGGSPGELLAAANRWCLDQLTRLNQDILAGRRAREDFRRELAGSVLLRLPEPESFSPAQAQQAVVLLGMAGASLGRHYQEADPSHRATPRQAFDTLTAGPGRQPFSEYYAQLGARTLVGHGPRDSYASLVRWNVPDVEVRLAGEQLAALPSVFDDGQVRSYTAAVDETRFFGLLKASEVVELAANRELLPLSEGAVDLAAPEALIRIWRATALLDTLRELNQDFAGRTPEDGLRVNFFMDVFRQFAVHWQPGDVPPSGAMDAESLNRDLLLGLALPDYPVHLRRVYPGLLAGERDTLDRLAERECLPRAALRAAGLTATDLANLTGAQLHQLVTRRPVLAALYLLLTAHAKVAGVHLRLSKVFLFAPQNIRDNEGLGDHGVVSNRSGTTGMNETWLETLTRARRQHLLRPLHAIASHTLEELGHPARAGSELSVVPRPEVRFVNSRIPAHDLGLPARWVSPVPGGSIIDLDGPRITTAGCGGGV